MLWYLRTPPNLPCQPVGGHRQPVGGPRHRSPEGGGGSGKGLERPPPCASQFSSSLGTKLHHQALFDLKMFAAHSSGFVVTDPRPIQPSGLDRPHFRRCPLPPPHPPTVRVQGCIPGPLQRCMHTWSNFCGTCPEPHWASCTRISAASHRFRGAAGCRVSGGHGKATPGMICMPVGRE